MKQYSTILLLALAFYATHSSAEKKHMGLSTNKRITSNALRYDLQYRVYTPPNYENLSALPVIYITDGQQYIKILNTPNKINKLIENQEIEPIIAVFIDPRDPDKLSKNRRNEEFYCNTNYANFVSDELVKEIDNSYKTSPKPQDRVILGLSFGGLNAACFGLIRHDTFSGIAMQSPAMHPVPNLFGTYRNTDKLPLKIFLSTGTKNDNENKTRAFRRILKNKGYELKYMEVDAEHNWKNWKPLMDDVLLYYFAKEAPNSNLIKK